MDYNICFRLCLQAGPQKLHCGLGGSILLIITKTTVHSLFAILAFLYCGEFVKNSIQFILVWIIEIH